MGTPRGRGRYDTGAAFVGESLAADLEDRGVVAGSVLLARRAGPFTTLMGRVWGPVRCRVLVVGDGEVTAFTALGHHRGLRREEGRCRLDRVRLTAGRHGQVVAECPGAGRYLLEAASADLARTTLG